MVKLPIWKGYHIFLNLYWCNNYICTIEVLPSWIVPIFCLAHGLHQAETVSDWLNPSSLGTMSASAYVYNLA